MNEYVELLWSQLKDVLYVTPEQFAEGYEDCEFDPLRRADGSIWLLFIVKGPEFHFIKLGDEPADKDVLRKYPGSLIEKHGYALTKTPKEDVRQVRFNQRLGFFVTGEDEFDFHMRIEKLRYVHT